jgi:hypothetical protein
VAHTVKKWNYEIEPWSKNRFKSPKAFHHVFFGLWDNANPLKKDNKDDDRQSDIKSILSYLINYTFKIHIESPLVGFIYKGNLAEMKITNEFG